MGFDSAEYVDEAGRELTAQEFVLRIYPKAKVDELQCLFYVLSNGEPTSRITSFVGNAATAWECAAEYIKREMLEKLSR